MQERGTGRRLAGKEKDCERREVGEWQKGKERGKFRGIRDGKCEKKERKKA